MREETDTSILFIFHGPPALLTPFYPPGLLSYPALASARSFPHTLLCSDLRFPEIASCLGTFSASEIASDTHPVASAAELQSHRRILALGLTERIICSFKEPPKIQVSDFSYHLAEQSIYNPLPLLPYQSCTSTPLRLPDQHPAKEVSIISSRVGDGGSQPGELPENNFMCIQDTPPTLYGQLLAWQITTEHSIDAADGIEPVERIKSGIHFQGEIVIRYKKQALEEAKKYRASLVIWTDGSKLDRNVGAAVCWKDKRLDQWKEKVDFLEKNKGILDV